MSDATFYVYEHWRPDTGQCFYVGKGRGKRAWFLARRNRRHKAVISKLTASGLAPEIRIVASGLTNDQACLIEISLISKYGRSALCNLTDGGEGALGWVPSPETRAKISSANSGKKRTEEQKKQISAHFKSMPRTAAHKAAISTALKGRKISDEHKKAVGESARKRKGMKRAPWTDQRRKNLSAALKGKPCWNKGRSMSKESRQKMSASAKARCARVAAAKEAA